MRGQKDVELAITGCGVNAALVGAERLRRGEGAPSQDAGGAGRFPFGGRFSGVAKRSGSDRLLHERKP